MLKYWFLFRIPNNRNAIFVAASLRKHLCYILDCSMFAKVSFEKQSSNSKSVVRKATLQKEGEIALPILPGTCRS